MKTVFVNLEETPTAGVGARLVPFAVWNGSSVLKFFTSPLSFDLMEKQLKDHCDPGQPYVCS